MLDTARGPGLSATALSRWSAVVSSHCYCRPAAAMAFPEWLELAQARHASGTLATRIADRLLRR